MALRRHEVLVRSKALFRAGDYRQVRRLVAEPATGTPTEEAALANLDSCAARLLGESPSPCVLRGYDPSDPIADDVVYWRAFAAWLDGTFNVADRLVREHRIHTDYYRAAFPILRGWIFAARGEFPQQIALTTQVLARLLEADRADDYLIANASLALAALAREMPSVTAQALLERALARISLSYRSTLLHVRRSLAQIDALHGRYTSALRHLVFAGELAQEPVERAFLHFDYALIATWADQKAAAEASFDVGRATIAEIDFEGRPDEGAFALTVGAIAGAGINRGAAAVLAHRAAGVIPNISQRWGVTRGGRAQALINEALALTSTHGEDAIERATLAGKEFESIGYLWRAGRLSAHLYELTGHASYRLRSERLLEAYSSGPLARNEDPIKLPPRLREILDLLRRGERIESIAARLKISPNTVRKHVSRLHSHYGVSRRAELLAKVGTLAS